MAQRATNPEHFANLKAELYDGLRERFQQGRIRIPNNQKLISELASIRYSFTSSGQTRLEDKDELRGRGQPSPDMADALMLAFAHSPSAGSGCGPETARNSRYLADRCSATAGAPGSGFA